MSIASTRLGLWQQIRAPFDRLFLALPLPRVNPDIVSVTSVVVAFLFVVAFGLQWRWVAWGILLLHLILDGLDGAIAKRYADTYRATEEARDHGVVVDLLTDRISEGILFVVPAFFLPWFPLFILNVGLSIFTYVRQRAAVMPFRQAFFLVYTISLLT